MNLEEIFTLLQEQAQALGNCRIILEHLPDAIFGGGAYGEWRYTIERLDQRGMPIKQDNEDHVDA